MQQHQRWPSAGAFVGDAEPRNLDLLHDTSPPRFDPGLPSHRRIGTECPCLPRPTSRPMAAASLRLSPTRLASTWMGLTHRPGWCRCGLDGAVVVLTDRAISVPFRARRHWSATANHDSRSPDLRTSAYGCAAARMACKRSSWNGWLLHNADPFERASARLHFPRRVVGPVSGSSGSPGRSRGGCLRCL
jgi:hypothetical protein